jgi:signal transduction histidine kinase/CheY-like chemotaxis protein
MALSNPELAPADAAHLPSFTEEAQDLRGEIMNGAVLGPAIALGWIAAFVSLMAQRGNIDWVDLGLKLSIAILALVCATLRRTNERASLWLCGSGLWVLAVVAVWLHPTALQAMWLVLACQVIALLLGGMAGWTASTLSLAALVFIFYRTAPGANTITSTEIASIALMTVLGVWLVRQVSTVLLRTLRWMNESYAAARLRAQQVSESSAELSTALKNLQQTSSALARANAQLEDMVRYAEDARRSKQEFAANVSHELRTPLNLIIGFSDLILRAPAVYAVNLPARLLSDIKVVHRNAHHLLSLINDILDLSQLDVNYMTITREPVLLGDFVEHALTDFRELIRERNLTLTVDIAPDLPEIYADRTRIRQVLLNLIANALRFTDHGGITVRVRQEGDYIKITVIDTGIGIPAHDLERIFEPFTQADSALGRKYGGTGLGLTISKEFVSLHGGRMLVESEPGCGSAFSFTLPVTVGLPEAHSLPARWNERIPGVRTLLVLEPGNTLARVLSHHLEGVNVLQAPTSEDFFARYPDLHPDVIVLNQPPRADTPENGGADDASLALVGGWPSEWRTAPMLSCYVAGPETDLQSAQVKHYLTKPITQDAFNAVLREMLGAPGDENTPGQRNGRVLMVEDDEDALRLLSRMLRATPSESRGPFRSLLSLEARSGEQALEIIQSISAGPSAETETAASQIDAILLDLNLGALSGQDVLLALREHPLLCRVPVCIVSARQLRVDPMSSTHLSIHKPGNGPTHGGIMVRELADAIRALLPVISARQVASGAKPGAGM